VQEKRAPARGGQKEGPGGQKVLGSMASVETGGSTDLEEDGARPLDGLRGMGRESSKAADGGVTARLASVDLLLSRFRRETLWLRREKKKRVCTGEREEGIEILIGGQPTRYKDSQPRGPGSGTEETQGGTSLVERTGEILGKALAKKHSY